MLEFFVTKRRDRRAALSFLKKTVKRYTPPKVIVTDQLRSYRAAMVQLGNDKRQETGRWLNNRGESSHLPFRRREHPMQRFRREKTLQTFVYVHSEVCNHFNYERHLISRADFKGKREAALVEWQQLYTAWIAKSDQKTETSSRSSEVPVGFQLSSIDCQIMASLSDTNTI